MERRDLPLPFILARDVTGHKLQTLCSRLSSHNHYSKQWPSARLGGHSLSLAHQLQDTQPHPLPLGSLAELPSATASLDGVADPPHGARGTGGNQLPSVTQEAV